MQTQFSLTLSFTVHASVHPSQISVFFLNCCCSFNIAIFFMLKTLECKYKKLLYEEDTYKISFQI